ncbi:MAG: MBL fold metallo-hydrolase [Candidatus Thorarchaeota archaeon]
MNKIKIDYITVNDNIIVHRKTGSEVNEGNITCVNMKDGLIFIDTGRNANETLKFRKDMEAKFSKETKFVILSHSHNDHYFGIAAFKDVPIIASKIFYEQYFEQEKQGLLSKEYRQKSVDHIKGEANQGKYTLSEQWHKDWSINFVNAELLPISFGISDELVIGDKDQQLIFKTIGGHTACSGYLHYLPDNILITGDNFNCMHARNSGCMLAGINWDLLEILKKFEDMNPTKIIPGHGPVVEKEYITTSREYFSSTLTKLKELKEKGLSEEEAIQSPELPEFFEEEKHERHDFILSNWFKQL